jgi:hypothetical protein
MNLKQLVNNSELWVAFLSEMDDRIKVVQKQMSVADEPRDLYRYQGELKQLNSLKRLREKVNNG